jgi:membrane protease YdiL (CAAX protease family)
MEKFVVPRNVGDSPEIFGVTAEQGVLFGVSIIAGLWFSAALYGFLAGIVLGMAYGRVSKKYPDGMLVHGLLWFGLASTKSKTVPRADQRDFYS